MKPLSNFVKYLPGLPIAVYLSLAFSAPLIADGHSHVEKVMSVTGSASASVKPDLVTVRFGVETQRESSASALSANAQLMEAVVASLIDAGISEEEISTSRFNVHAVYETRQDRGSGHRSQVLSGYKVSNMLLVETRQLELVATIIDTAVSAGVNRIEGVQFSISAPVLADLKDGLIELAVLNARAKAEKALAPLKHVITGVKSMSLSEFSQPEPMLLNTSRMEMSMAAPTRIFSSDQDVRTMVNITFLSDEQSTDQ